MAKLKQKGLAAARRKLNRKRKRKGTTKKGCSVKVVAHCRKKRGRLIGKFKDKSGKVSRFVDDDA